jgi:RHH-type proline utilization regulon transcriptional repressor/proline dehydrogenase/delta 1-pyrroline-5-carboxylate dehydrogenase
MQKSHRESPHLHAAIELLESVQGKVMTVKQRQEAAVELASYMLDEANDIQTHEEKKKQAQLARMMRDPRGKAFTTSMTDQCFRSSRSSRVANQLVYLLNLFGIPKYLDFFKRVELGIFQVFGKALSFLFVPFATWALRRETATVILPGERRALSKHMQKRRKEGVRLNLNHLGEAILGEAEAARRLDVYLKDLAQNDIEYVSVKISTIFSQINLLSWDKTLDKLAEQLRKLYRVAQSHMFTHADGTRTPKFVNLDMEEYRDLKLTVALFKQVLEEPEFHKFSAGIVLQAYLPDAHEIQKELTTWAMNRVKNKGAPIKIRIVKGANLAMEQFEASLRGWPQAPYTNKIDVDANYKRMVSYGCMPDHAKAATLGIASHNLFDIAFAMLLRAEYAVEEEVSFEMLEGMADHIRRVVQKLSKDMLLYCPVAVKEDFQSAVAYLIRRLDENTGPDNFLRHTFGLKPQTSEWNGQVKLFAQACEEVHTAPVGPRKHQNRLEPPKAPDAAAPFDNESDTDFSLPHNRKWANEIVAKWKQFNYDTVPCMIGGKEIYQIDPQGKGFDPSSPDQVLYTYSMADWHQADMALKVAKAKEASWSKTSVEERSRLLAQAAQKLREKRGDLIGVMIGDGGKTPFESDPEISEAIDFAEYYRRSMIKMDACKDISWKPKGTVLVAPPWNFPTSIPAGGIFAALAAGNCVLFKPAPEAVYTGWVLVKALWEAGISKDVLQFINCADEPVGTKLISDSRINAVILTGATSTARFFLKTRPDIDLAAETGGKNAMIITGMADRDLAIKDLVQSAFGHSGQKCSAASLAILEAEVYDSPHFREQLKDAVMSLTVGSAWDMSSKVVPLIREPNPTLLRGLTSLEPGEEWLVEPRCLSNCPTLWSPGVKLGVKEGSFMHKTELFGPVLGIMRAKNLQHAIQLANGTPYGLTSGLQSLDEREHNQWLEKIEAGNLYINRSITGAIVRRQPFGGCKASSFGHGAKAGGPNYVAQFAVPTQELLPQEKSPVGPLVDNLTNFIEKIQLTDEELGLWYASISNYGFWGKRFHHDHDPSKIIGQDNFLRYRPYHGIVLRIHAEDAPLDILRICAAALTTETPIQISWTKGQAKVAINDQWGHLMPLFRIVQETEAQFLERVRCGAFKRVRLLSRPSKDLQKAAAASACHLDAAPVLANGRFELLHYLREIAISTDYHRYGNLGVREGEIRKPLL